MSIPASAPAWSRAPLAAARAALERGDLARGAQLAESVLQADRTIAEAAFLLAMALSDSGHVGNALKFVEEASRLAPGNAEYAAQHARLLVLLRREAEARTQALRALASVERTPAKPIIYDTIAGVLARLGEHGMALPLFERAVKADPDNLSYRFNFAVSLGFFDRIDQAEHQYEAILARDPANGPAHYGIARLRRQTPARNHVARIEAALARVRDHDAWMQLHYAAAKEHEDLGNAQATFAHLDTANRAHQAKRGYRHEDDACIADALRDRLARADYFNGPGFADAAPIFVVGLPRTGTTLVDRILGSHPQVHSLGELQAMPLAVKQLSQSRSRVVLDPETIERVGTVSPRAVGESYVAQSRAQAGAHQDRVLLDKFPLNFLYIGHIARALPHAKIVCLRRQPLDSIWSNFKHLFALNSPYYDWSYDLMNAARYYVLFDRLMAFYRQALPGRVLELGYERLIADQKGETARLLAHCGLPWDDACLAFHDREGPVATPSAQQVRKPLNRDSVERWRSHADRLAPAAAFLREAGIACD